MSQDKEKEEFVITPAGRRPKSSVRAVKPGEVIRGNKKGRIRVVGKKVSTRTAKITEELALTPGGFRNKSLVHVIEPGHVLDEMTGVFQKKSFDGEVVAEYGEVVRKKKARPLMPDNVVLPARKIIPALGQGWIVYAGWYETTVGHITLFKTTWKVPPAPLTQSGQTIFLFNGIENSNRIYQPVLQWGTSAAGGGNYWTVASWYVNGSTGPVLHTIPVSVNVGDVLTGVMVLTGISKKPGSSDEILCSYNCYFQGISNTSLPVENIEELYWANETLEAYHIQKCSDYPATLKTSMKNIELVVDAHVRGLPPILLHPILNWQPHDRITDCGQHCVVVSNANPGGQVDLYYRNKTKWDDLAKNFFKEIKDYDYFKLIWENPFKVPDVGQIDKWIEQWMHEQNIDEATKAEFAHFIREKMRPDLKTSSLKQEPDQSKKAEK
jgi:hypothetical protein